MTSSGSQAAYDTPEYVAWRNMLARCRDPYNRRWAQYGGAGVQVCERWRSFQAFRADIGRRPEGCVLARRDKAGDFTPENCFWEDRSQTVRRQRSTMTVTYGTETLHIAEWAQRTGLRAGTIRSRLRILGWTVGQALGLEPRRPSRPQKLPTVRRASLIGDRSSVSSRP